MARNPASLSAPNCIAGDCGVVSVPTASGLRGGMCVSVCDSSLYRLQPRLSESVYPTYCTIRIYLFFNYDSLFSIPYVVIHIHNIRIIYVNIYVVIHTVYSYCGTLMSHCQWPCSHQLKTSYMFYTVHGFSGIAFENTYYILYKMDMYEK